MKKSLLWASIFLFISALHADIFVSIPQSEIVVKKVDGYAKFIGNEFCGEPGCPLLPSKSYTFLISPDADLSTVSFHFQGLNETVLEGSYKVKPTSPPYSIDGPVWPKNRNIVDGKDVDVYSSNTYYPNSYIQDVSVGMMRCYKVVKVRVFYSRYNPVSGKLKCITGGNLVLNVTRKPLDKNIKYKVPVKFKKLAERLVINYDEMAHSYNSVYSFTKNSKYIIMTSSAIQSTSTKLEDLKNSKINQGFDVQILTESDWGGGTGDATADNMREWLQDNYEQMGIEYVLIIGDPSSDNSKIPMKYSSSRNTDFYYSELTGPWEEDILAEVSASRIPVYNDDYATLDKILEKVITYENTPQGDIGWRDFCFIAEKPYDDQTPGSPLFEEIREKFLDPNGWDNYRIYDDNNGNPDESDCNTTAVKDAWNELTFGLMLWMTHGNSTGASSIMSSSTMQTFSDDYPSIVFMGSCSNASISTSNNLTYIALKHASIGAIGGTGVTWYGDAQVDNFEGTSTTQGLLYHFAEGISDSLGAGDALNFAIGKCSDKKYWCNILGYVLYGCPDVGIFTAEQGTGIQDIPENPVNSAASERLVAVTTKTNKVNFFFTAKSGDLYTNLIVYDVLGNTIYERTGHKYLSDSYKFNKLFTWDLNQNGSVSSGVYIAVLRLKDYATGNESLIKNRVVINKR